MSYSKETLDAVARELWGTPGAGPEADEVRHWVNLCLDGLAELDALDLEAQEPVPVVVLPAPDADERPSGGTRA